MKPWVHIIGLGASGCSLVEALARYDCLPGDVLISDPDPSVICDKGYGFWYRTSEFDLFKPDSYWDSWSFSTNSKQVVHTGTQFKYGYRSGQSIFDTVSDLVSNHSQIKLVREAVQSAPEADFIFDSRPVSPHRYVVNQAFYGMVIETSSAHQFDVVGLMEDLTSNDRGLIFRYLLPFTNTKLLIEYTEFTAETPDFLDLKSKVLQWCDQYLGSDYKVIKQEQASIPMGLEGEELSFGTPIGVRGGRVRDSSGYSYYYAIKDAYRIANELVERGNFSPNKPNNLESWMDAKLLWLIRRRPHVLPEIFFRLATQMTNDRFASFMSVNARRDSMMAIAASPKRPFLRSLMGDF